MWPNSRGFNLRPQSALASAATQIQSEYKQTKTSSAMSSMSSLDSNQLLMAANSLRTLFGDNVNQNVFQSNQTYNVRDNTPAARLDTSAAPMGAQRAPERRDYESQHFTRLDRNLMNQMSNNLNRNTQPLDDSPPMRTENRFYDPTKMPQKSILKKSRDQAFDSQSFRTVEDEDQYLYGSSAPISGPTSATGAASGGLPPGIVQLEQRPNRSTDTEERALSPISLRLKREMENMDRSMTSNEPKEDKHWSERIAEEPVVRRNDWTEDDDDYQRRYRQHMNPSPVREDELSLERVRLQQMAAIQAGILTKTEPRPQRSPPKSSSALGSARRPITITLSPEPTPKRMRRRSPSLSPRRRSVSPRRRSISPRYRRARSRSTSRDRYRRSRSRSRSRGRSDSRNRSHRRSRSPDRRRSSRSPNRRLSESSPNRTNPTAPIIPMGAQAYDLPFLTHPSLVGAPVAPLMAQYMHPMLTAYPHLMAQNMSQMSANLLKPNARNMSSLKAIPLTNTGAQPMARKELERKEDKLINPKDLLIAERSKLREELVALKRQCDRKIEEQNVIVAKDGGTDSYAYRQLDKVIKELKTTAEVIQNKLSTNFQLFNDVQKSKNKEKDFISKVKTTGDISKVEPKKSTKQSAKPSPKKSGNSAEKKSAKEEKKEAIDEEEEEEKNSRFHYFDSGPHWCQCCDKFSDNMKQYFSHIHSKDHLNRHKESDRTPWITKDYIKQLEKEVARSKNQLLVASKGIQFIHPTQGFYCELCKQFLNDSYEAEKHFKTAKHNRNYTRYTLLHNDYEHKWKAERDKAFTEMKKKERELEKEKSDKEYEERVKQRKKLEEEVKRKDKDLKEKIEAMNKSLKTVKELDDSKGTEQKKEDKTKSSPKNIRLNLSSKTESNDKSKKDEKSEEKSEKTNEKTDSSDKSKKTEEKIEKTPEKAESVTKIKEKPKEKSENKPKNEEMVENSEGLDDMLVIDEINCESQDESMNNNSIDETIDETIDENNLLYPEITENTNSGQTSDAIDAKKSQKSDGNVEKMIENYVNKAKNGEQKGTEPKTSTEKAKESIENNENENNSEVEGVMPEMETNSSETNADNVCNDKQNEKSETKPEPMDETNKMDGLVDKNDEKAVIESKNEEPIEVQKESQKDVTNGREKEDSDKNCVDNQNQISTENITKDSVVSDTNGEQQKADDKQTDRVVEKVVEDVNSRSKEDESHGSVAEDIGVKVEKPVPTVMAADLDLDFDIAKLNERFEEMVKNEVKPEPDGDSEDELEGFDVIDETNEDVVELSD